MKFAISLPCTGPLATGPAALDSLRIVAQKAEALGLESIWVPDHVVIPTTVNSRYPYNKSGKFPLPPEMGFLEPMTALGFLAGVTQRIRLGTSALVLPHRNPILTAKMIATLDVLSQGRIILGAGIGWMEEEISLLGAPFKRRGALSDEYLRAMRELWTNPDPHFEGEFCHFSGIKCEPKPVQKPLPVWIGGHSNRAMRRIAEYGDGWLAVPKTLEDFQDGVARLKSACDTAGRDVTRLEILIAPGYAPNLESFLDQVKQYQDLGYEYFSASIPYWSKDLEHALGIMEEFAEKVGLSIV